jgi:hypothetical protein
MKRKQPQPSDPIDLAARALRHHDRSRSQIDDRLARAGVADERRAEALEALEGRLRQRRTGSRRGATPSRPGLR